MILSLLWAFACKISHVPMRMTGSNREASPFPDLTSGDRKELGYASALNVPPKDVQIVVTDNDAAAAQAALTSACRQTRLFQFADSRGDVGSRSAVLGDGVLSTKWLTDYNCESGDAGGLPGYPVISYPETTDPTYGLAGTGYCTDKTSATKTACDAASSTCSIAGTCPSTAHIYYADVTVATECGTCSIADRYTEAECTKAISSSPMGRTTGTGTWTAVTLVTSGHDTQAECEAAGATWITPKWVVHPVGSGMVAQDSARNLQCCTCLPAFKSGVATTTLASYTDEAACNGVEGGTWTCEGVGPHCTV